MKNELYVESNEACSENIRMITKEIELIREVIIVQQSQMTNMQSVLEKKIEILIKEIREVRRISQESEWGIVFNNTIMGSEWFCNQALSLGRMAIGYPCAYALYNILNEYKPKKIIELGLGQSTKMIMQYTSAHKNTEHTVIENDQDWIEFFRKCNDIPNGTNIIQCDVASTEYEQFENVRQYVGFSKLIQNKKFDFIFIDGPKGYDMKDYSRVDILDLLPECLEKSFIILFDDCNRSGEMNSFLRIQEVLRQNAIEYEIGLYCGKVHTRIICSKDLAFLCSL